MSRHSRPMESGFSACSNHRMGRMTLPDSSDRLIRLGLVAALLVGIAVRVLPVVSSPLPLGDGGLFWSMVEDIRANGLLPPETTHYNGIDIPFLYPPLGLL